jgi:hypothetical protein
MVVFWVLTSCGLVYGYHADGGSMFLRNTAAHKQVLTALNSENYGRHLHGRENLKFNTEPSLFRRQ